MNLGVLSVILAVVGVVASLILGQTLPLVMVLVAMLYIFVISEYILKREVPALATMGVALLIYGISNIISVLPNIKDVLVSIANTLQFVIIPLIFAMLGIIMVVMGGKLTEVPYKDILEVVLPLIFFILLISLSTAYPATDLFSVFKILIYYGIGVIFLLIAIVEATVRIKT